MGCWWDAGGMLVGPEGLEPPTTPLCAVRSNQLNYRPSNHWIAELRLIIKETSQFLRP